MARRRRDGVPIDHARIIDGFGELAGRQTYEPREVRCRVCGVRFVFTPRDQKYVHEVRGVPIKMAARAAYCPACLPAKARESRERAQIGRAHRALQRAHAVEKEQPSSAEAILESVRAHLALLELAPSPRSAAKLVLRVRRALRLDPSLHEARYWEARAREAAGEHEAAAAAYDAFVDVARDVPRLRALVRDAKARRAKQPR